MAHTSSSSAPPALDARERAVLLDVAYEAIREGRRLGGPPAQSLETYPPALRAHAATFVTLHLAGELRGCIGTLEACQPLAVDTAKNAYAAAYRDPRFPALTPPEIADVDVHISILTPPEPLVFATEEELLAQLRPGLDGLILSERGRRSTFLPAVWETVGEPREFLARLKLKAGLPADYWSDTIRVSRYATLDVA
ncbi:MAG TPA: AmmeMemoRadiSam system protein A [Burkholderiales bacterium]